MPWVAGGWVGGEIGGVIYITGAHSNRLLLPYLSINQVVGGWQVDGWLTYPVPRVIEEAGGGKHPLLPVHAPLDEDEDYHVPILGGWVGGWVGGRLS